MNYKFTFEKISPENEFAGVGFAGNIFIILNALTYLSDDDRLFVDMETNDCVCTEKGPTIYSTKNCWEYYFNQTTLTEDYKNINFYTPSVLSYENKDAFINTEIFIDLKRKFYDSFQIKPYIVEKINEYYQNNLENKITLGVQVRLTDMAHNHRVSPLKSYIKKINQILSNNNDIKQIFLATDDGSIIETLKENISIPIIYHYGMSRSDSNSPNLNPYDRYKNGGEHHMYRMGLECLLEILTLSKCDYLLKADVSSLSLTSVILSENIKKVYRI
jgi:hypothetical protein